MNSAMPINRLERNLSLDAARSILMMLGVLMHTANIYSIKSHWIISDAQRSDWFDLIVNLIHVFRMPTFFWISGYFCAMTFERNGSNGLLQKRIPRIAIPLIATWLTLNTVQEMFMAWLKGQSIVGSIIDGVPLFQLWFLIDLLFYIGIAAIVLPWCRRFQLAAQRFESLSLIVMLPLLAFLSIFFSLVVRSSGVAYDLIFGFTSLFRLVTDAPYFIVGVFMYSRAGARQTFLRLPVILIIAALPFAVYLQKFAIGQSFFISESAFFLETLMVWICVAVILRLFHDLVRRESQIVRFLSESAYTVYLFHHILVVIFGLILIDYMIGAWLKFLIVCSFSFTASLLIHVAFVRRSRIVRLLFNGK